MVCVKNVRSIRGLWFVCISLVLVKSILLAGCAAQAPSLDTWLKNEQVNRATVEVDGYPVQVITKQAEGPLRIYIEGDGRAYITAYEPSGDPTPVNPVALKLALLDQSGANIVYLGRPCQWVRGAVCRDRGLWTTGRFTAEMAQLYVKLVEQYSRGEPVELVGYSGGAWLALQVAAKLPNVVNVRTVAGNLDPDAVNRIHKATKVAVAPWGDGIQLQGVPQVHYTGVEDKIVPPGVVEAYRDRVRPTCMEVVRVAASHGEGWEARWGEISREPIAPCEIPMDY